MALILELTTSHFSQPEPSRGVPYQHLHYLHHLHLHHLQQFASAKWLEWKAKGHQIGPVGRPGGKVRTYLDRFQTRAVSFGRKILLWASIMFAQGLTWGKIAAKFSIFFLFFLLSLLTSAWVWECFTDGGLWKTDCGSHTALSGWSTCWYGAVGERGRRSDTFSINSVELHSMYVGKCMTIDDDG